jgi:AcrB/AcrD/AcrF family
LFSGIFIDRPRFATVIAVVITLADLIAIRSIPIQFPDIVPPQVTLTANYPGADPEVIENCRRPGVVASAPWRPDKNRPALIYSKAVRVPVNRALLASPADIDVTT